MDVDDLFVALTISNQPLLTARNIIVIASREFGFDAFLIVNGPTRSTQIITQ
jgi:hypothetical protein